MPKFKIINFTVFPILSFLLMCNFFIHPVYWAIFATIISIYLFLLIFFSFYIKGNYYVKSICYSKEEEKAISLTFDDGPMQNYTSQILNILKKHNIEACFFCIGKNSEENTEILKQIHINGHIIGNHSYCHSKAFDLFSAKRIINDINEADKIIKNNFGFVTKFFRPPFGVTNPTIYKSIKATNKISIGWNVRSLDTNHEDKNKVLRRLQGIKPGDIILFHDICKVTTDVLEDFINECKTKGITFKRLDKMINIEPYEI